MVAFFFFQDRINSLTDHPGGFNIPATREKRCIGISEEQSKCSSAEAFVSEMNVVKTERYKTISDLS